ncbi:MAG TPA: serine/threonine-protein kinase, partial [Polyangiaceae bacterium]
MSFAAGSPLVPPSRQAAVPFQESLAAAQVRFKRALTVAYSMWFLFTGVDWIAGRYLDGPGFGYFLALRILVLVAVCPVLIRLYRSPPPDARVLTILDLVGYTAPSVSIALMCARFHGLASPYAPGLCLVLLARTVTAQEPWRRGLLMSGVPVGSFYVVLLGSALFLPQVAAQFHNAAAATMLMLSSAYILGTYVFLVFGGHVIWALRQQIYEARDLGRYRLRRRLASGGMGDVWVAYHPGLKRDVAIKILRTETGSAEAVHRFEREARATADLLHPNTIRVFDYGATDDGLWYYVMELLEGETLQQHVDRVGPLPAARAVHIIGQAARALGEAHERGIVHRDVKPQNLFLTSLGGEHDFVKVLDFGIAKVVADTDGTVTQTGLVLGTPSYMSPEVVVGGSADARSDVYALGAVLYFLLSGAPPFEGAEARALFLAHVSEEVVPPSKRLGKEVPADLEALVLRALSKDPSARYSSASEFALALAACTVAGKWTFGDAVVARQSTRP